MDYVEQGYWDKSYQQLDLSTLYVDPLVRNWIQSFIPKSNGTCIEIGCFPGGNLTTFGDLGYKLHGIDLTPRVEKDLHKMFKSKGYRVGEFKRIDFLEFKPEKKYDIVCSFGFIEHFSDWKGVLSRHASLVNENGFLIIEAPNFRGSVQRILHTFLDKENLSNHNIHSMVPYQWKKHIESLGFESVFCGYFGNFKFWVDDCKRNWLQKLTINLIQSSTKRFLKYLPNNRLYSPCCGLIARRVK